MWTSGPRSLFSCRRAFAHVECEACTHRYIVDLEIQSDGEVMPIYPKACPECGANYDMDLLDVTVFGLRFSF